MGNSMGKGLPSTQMLGYVFKSLHQQFIETEIKEFDDFHAAILDILSVVNSALPGKHYDAPARSEVEKFFKEWNAEEDEDKKREAFTEFMKKIKLSKLDNNTIIAGIVTPPAAMAAKRAGEFLPHMSMIKAIPDLVFVPSVTIAALVISKLSRRLYRQSLLSQPPTSKSFDGDKTKDLEPQPAPLPEPPTPASASPAPAPESAPKVPTPASASPAPAPESAPTPASASPAPAPESAPKVPMPAVPAVSPPSID